MWHLSKIWEKNLMSGTCTGNSIVPAKFGYGALPSCRKLKHTVNKVSSLRDSGGMVLLRYRKLKHTVNKVSSLRDLGRGVISYRKLKHTVNKVSSLRDSGGMVLLRYRKLKHTVNKVSSLRDFTAYSSDIRKASPQSLISHHSSLITHRSSLISHRNFLSNNNIKIYRL
jgi:hypothetical protein